MQVMPQQQGPVHTGPRSGADMNDIGKDAKPEKFTQAMSKLIMQQPFYAVILLDGMQVVFTDSVQTMATDGMRIYVNPTFSESLTVDENVFVICHEVLHYIFQHMQRGKLYQDRGFGPDLLPYSHDRMNRAEDYIINDILIRGKVGSMPAMGLHDTNMATYDDIADEVYPKVPKEDGDGGGGGQPGHGGFDEHLNPNPNQPQPTQADVQRTVAQARNAAKAQGKMPGDLERIIGEVLEPTKDWAEILRDEMINAIGRDEATWARLNRRRLCMNPQVCMPGMTGYATGHVVIQIDTSGSISDDEFKAFISEVMGILIDGRPERVTVLWVDAEVQGDPVELDYPEQLVELEPKGGGGTDMRAGVKWCIEQGIAPSCFVCLTDGYTPWPDSEPGFHTIWVVTHESAMDCKVGMSIHLDLDAAGRV